uniref:Uncharacterized protein n=1 Tax=Vespula pensylvanica TaxID=30213 RepID=A0A834N8N5_VESPE|nr:hypothetical protein H0235_015612 [Vespula pensylvanica]
MQRTSLCSVDTWTAKILSGSLLSDSTNRLEKIIGSRASSTLSSEKGDDLLGVYQARRVLTRDGSSTCVIPITGLHIDPCAIARVGKETFAVGWLVVRIRLGPSASAIGPTDPLAMTLCPT